MKQHADLFSRVDAILTPGTPITAPPVAADGLQFGESNLTQTANLMRYS